MSGLIKGIHHVSMKTVGLEEFEKAVSFYCDILGCKLLRSWGDDQRRSAMIDTGAGIIELGSTGTEKQPAGVIFHYALATDDVDGAVEAIRNAGYTITLEPRDGMLPSNPPMPIKVAFCVGPCGESLELFCEK